MRFKRKRVHRLSIDGPSRRDQFSRHALAHEPFGVAAVKGWPFVILSHAIHAHRHEAHHLHAASDDEVVRPGDDPMGREVKRLLRRTTFAIERHRGHAFGKACGEDSLPANVARLLRDLDHATGDHVFDQRRIDARPSHESLQDLSVEVDRMHAVQHAAGTPTSERRSHDVDDDGSAHRSFLPLSSPRAAGRATASRSESARPATWRCASGAGPDRVQATTAAESLASPDRPRAFS